MTKKIEVVCDSLRNHFFDVNYRLNDDTAILSLNIFMNDEEPLEITIYWDEDFGWRIEHPEFGPSLTVENTLAAFLMELSEQTQLH